MLGLNHPGDIGVKIGHFRYQLAGLRTWEKSQRPADTDTIMYHWRQSEIVSGIAPSLGQYQVPIAGAPSRTLDTGRCLSTIRR